VYIVLLILAALTAGAEVAVLDLSTSSLEKIEDQTDRRSLIIKEFIKDPEKLHLTTSIFTIIILVVTFLILLPVFEKLTFLESCNWPVFLLPDARLAP
jgi:CBS domain containing-hemolysin-like protein